MTWAIKTLSYAKPSCKNFFGCYNKANCSGGKFVRSRTKLVERPWTQRLFPENKKLKEINMKNKKLCSLLMATVMLTSVTAFSSCDALDGVLKLGENIFDGAMGAVDGVFGGIVGSIEDIFGGGNSSDVGDSSDKDSSSTLKVKSISLDTSKAKLEFAFGEEFTAEGLKVTATMSDGSKQEVALADCRIVKPDTTKAGSRSVTVVYEGQTARYEITVLKKVIPPISKTSLLDITAVNDSVPYRVEAEAIDMVTPGVQKAEGVADFVANAPIDADITSGDKYLTGYNVQYNYFGFTFTAAEEYEGVTLVLRVANPTEADIDAGVMKMFLNFAQDENGDESGAISLDGYILEANGVGKWTDIVIRNVTIPQGTNTLTFEAQGDKAFDLDYIDFYVGMRYINSIVEIADTTTIVKDLENFDTEKAFTRADVAAAHGLKDGQLFVEPVTKESEGKTTSGGTSVGAIGKGSQMSTTLRLAQNATVRIKMKASAVGKGAYYVSDHWKFMVDGVELKMVERINIEGGNPGANEWWDWMYTNLGEYNLPAGDHLFLVEVFGTDCNVDTFEFEILSFGEYAENGTDLDNQHACESVCPICGKCTNENCTQEGHEDKCAGHEAPDEPVVSTDVTIDGAGEYKMEGENVDKSTLVLRSDFAAAGIGFTESWSNDFGSGACLKGYTNGSVLKFTVDVKEATTLTLTMRMSHYENAVYDFSNITFTFAGQTLTPVAQGEFGHREASDYWKWVDVALGEVEVEAGIYTFEMNIVNGGNANIDYFMFKVEGEAEPEQPEVTPDITITDEATSYKVEAELLDMTTLVPQAGFEKPVVESFTGGQGLGGIGAGGYQTFTVKSVKDVNVALKIAFAKFEGGSILNFIGGVSVNGESLTLTDGEVAPGTSENQWWNVSNVQVATLKLTADTVYTFKIMVNSGNLDGYVLEVFEKTPETTNVASDITLATTGVTKYELENIDYTKSSINTRDDFVNAGVCVEGDVGRGSGRIYGFDNGSTFRVYVTVEAACILKISLAGFGGNALNAYKYSFGGVELTPAEGAVLGNGAVAEGVIGTVTVAEAGVYCFEFTSGVNVDLDYVAFEVV